MMKMKLLLRIPVLIMVKMLEVMKILVMIWFLTLMILEKAEMMRMVEMAKMVKTKEMIMMEEMVVLGMMVEIIIFMVPTMMRMKKIMVTVGMGMIILKLMSKIALILESSSNLSLEPTTLKNMIQRNQRIITKILQKMSFMLMYEG